MTGCQNVDAAAAFNLIERHIARCLKRNDELAQERTLTGFAIDERRPAQVTCDARLDRVDGELGRIKARFGTLQVSVAREGPGTRRPSALCGRPPL
jgi:hypothetical protein